MAIDMTIAKKIAAAEAVLAVLKQQKPGALANNLSAPTRADVADVLNPDVISDNEPIDSLIRRVQKVIDTLKGLQNREVNRTVDNLRQNLGMKQDEETPSLPNPKDKR